MTKGALSEEDRKEIVKYRLEKSERAYKEAVGSINNGYVETAANRLYYAAYYAVSALLIAYGISAKAHSGVIQMFGLHFLKNKLVDRKLGTIYNQLFSLRMTGDYQDRKRLDIEADVKPLVKPAKDLIDVVSGLARDKIQ